MVFDFYIEIGKVIKVKNRSRLTFLLFKKFFSLCLPRNKVLSSLVFLLLLREDFVIYLSPFGITFLDYRTLKERERERGRRERGRYGGTRETFYKSVTIFVILSYRVNNEIR